MGHQKLARRFDVRSVIKKSAVAKKRGAAATKAAVTKKRRAAGRKAAATRKRRAVGKKAAATRKTRVATAMSKAAMLIRRPVADVFEAFVDPAITTQFWFTKSNGRLEPGKQVQWEWEMYRISIPVIAQTIEPNKRIVIEWPGYKNLTTVEWTFASQEDGSTFVTITESGFAGAGDELMKQVASSTEGFTLVLAGLKALLEHNVVLNLVADRFPKGIAE
jgi:uncharacterized protein YndB with AHSA1/START domain